MIKIVNGVYGMKIGNRVIPVTEKDGPIELAPEKEARLVKKGVAVYVDKPTTDDASEVEKKLPKYNEDMTREQLNKIALEYGIKKPEKARNKAELISWIDAAVNGEPDEDDDMPPVFNAADAVGD
jgi:hypothetical protein